MYPADFTHRRRVPAPPPRRPWPVAPHSRARVPRAPELMKHELLLRNPGRFSPQGVQQLMDAQVFAGQVEGMPPERRGGYFPPTPGVQGDPGIVWVRDDLPPPEQRYIMQHELGHYYDAMNGMPSTRTVPGDTFPAQFRGVPSHRYARDHVSSIPGVWGNEIDAEYGYDYGHGVVPWGDPGELYAELSVFPGKIPDVARDWYPQYSDAAFQPTPTHSRVPGLSPTGYLNWLMNGMRDR